jgi:uncharacterized membrane protein YesL
MKNQVNESANNPNNSLKQLFRIIYLNSFELISLNIFFLISCIPILTIPNAICSLTKTNLDLSENIGANPLKKYWKSFFTFNKRWLLSGFSYITAFFLLSYGLAIYLSTNTSATLFWIFCGFNILALALLIMVGFYLFPLLIGTELDQKTVWKHAFGMVVVEMKSTFALFSVIAALWILCIRFFRSTWIIFILIAFSLSSLIVIFYTRRWLAKYFPQFRNADSND